MSFSSSQEAASALMNSWFPQRWRDSMALWVTMEQSHLETTIPCLGGRALLPNSPGPLSSSHRFPLFNGYELG